MDCPAFLVNGFSVPITQELAKTYTLHPPPKVIDLPHRYIRPAHERPRFNVKPSCEQEELPVIDMALLADPQSQETKRLKQACEDWGFFQVINHGIPLSLLERMKGMTKGFFDLPLEERLKCSRQWKPTDMEGYGQGFVSSDEQKLDWSDAMWFNILPEQTRKPDLWPQSPADFRTDGYRETLQEYANELYGLIVKLLKIFAVNLGLKTETRILDYIEHWLLLWKALIYPASPHPDLVMGQSAHADVGIITLLLQSDDVEGLQVRRGGDEWVTVKPFPGAVVINLGDTLEVLSNGRYKSVEHRVITNSRKARLSIPSFHLPTDEQVIGPLPELIDEDHPALYKTMVWGEFMQYMFRGKLEGKKRASDFLKIDPST